MRSLQEVFATLRTSSFRSRVHLQQKELDYLKRKGMDVILEHAADFVNKRLAAANPLNDGKPTKYGFGWFIESIEGRKNIGHGGATSGFSASIQRFPDEHLAVILLTNTDEQIATTLARKIAMLWLQK